VEHHGRDLQRLCGRRLCGEHGPGLSAALVVSGSVAKVGPGLVLSLAMIDVARGEPVGRAEVKAADVGALYAQVPEAVDILLAPKKR
jgi:hypothetical protein